jgi:cell division protein FtsW (lipid II flippase)
MKRETGFFRQLDWWTIAIYMVLVLIGWISIFASVSIRNITVLSYHPAIRHADDLDIRRLVPCHRCVIDPSRTYLLFSGVFYILGILILLAVLVLGVERNGSQSGWSLARFIFSRRMAKVFVALALAGLMSRPQFRLRSLKGALEVNSHHSYSGNAYRNGERNRAGTCPVLFLLVLYRKVCPDGSLCRAVGYYSFFIVNYMEYAGVLWLVFGNALRFFAAGV